MKSDTLGRFRNRYGTLRPRTVSAQLTQPQIRVQEIPLDIDAGLGQRHFAKASVSCGLRGEYSKWGILRQKNAAIWQLFIDASQPLGYKLSEIILEISFFEDDPNQQGQVSLQPILAILEPPSPKILHGGSTSRHRSKEIKAEPQIEAAGVSFGGLGMSLTSESDTQSCWQFRGHRHFNDRGRYTIARWIWEANKENPQVENLGPLFAGVIIQHPSQPFFVSCKVQGKLLKFDKHFKYGSDDQERPQVSRIVPPKSDEDITIHAESLESEVKKLMLAS